MAVTLLNQPDAISSAYRPIKWDVQTDRLTSQSKAVTDTEIISSFTRYTVASTTGLLVDDVVLGSGFSDDRYNVRQEITNLSGVSIDTDLLFPGIDDLTGTLKRVNDNFQVKGEVWIFQKHCAR